MGQRQAKSESKECPAKDESIEQVEDVVKLDFSQEKEEAVKSQKEEKCAKDEGAVKIELKEEKKKKAGVSATTIDGGFGWAVVFAAAFTRFTVSGMICGMSFLLKPWETEYGVSSSSMGWLASIMFSLGIGAAPLASWGCCKFGHRVVSMVSSGLMAVALAVPYFFSPLWLLYLNVAVVCGVCINLVIVSGTFILTGYFQRRLSMAMGLHAASHGLSYFLMGPLINALITQFGWRVALLVTGGIVLINIPLVGFLYRPVVSATKKTEENPEQATEKVAQVNIVSSIVSQMNIATMETNQPREENNIDIQEHATDFIHVSVASLVGVSLVSNMNKQQDQKKEEQKEEVQEKPIDELPAATQPNLLRKILATLSNKVFLLYLITNFFVMLSSDSPQTYAKERAVQHGVNPNTAAYLVPLIGLGTVVGRLGFGFLGSLPQLGPYPLFAGAVIGCGGAFLLDTLASSFPIMGLANVLIGVTSGGYITLSCVVPAQLLPSHSFEIGICLMYVIQAIAILIGIPSAAGLYDASGTYDLPFGLCGAVSVLSGLAMFAAYASRHFRDSQKQQRQQKKQKNQQQL